MGLVYGFGGYRLRGKRPEFSPILPTRARRLRIQLLLRGSLLDIEIQEDRVTYCLHRGETLTASNRGEQFTVAQEEPMSFSGRYRTYDGNPQGEAAGKAPVEQASHRS